MYVIETLKGSIGRLTGAAKLTPVQIRARVRKRNAQTRHFKDDGATPNSPLPFVLYRGAVKVVGAPDPAAVFEQLFAANGWDDSWRNGIYDYLHYHSRIHEVLGIARGHARVRFGGDRGTIVTVKAGDVAVLPAGTGHHCLEASDDFLVVGAYPPVGTYDECRGLPAEHGRALKTIPRVARPRKDPLYGAEGRLPELWRAPPRWQRPPGRRAAKRTASAKRRTASTKRHSVSAKRTVSAKQRRKRARR
jgi:uncharacterized protein YjlB